MGPTTSNDDLATTLNATGHRTGKGRPFDIDAVQWVRYVHHIPTPGHLGPVLGGLVVQPYRAAVAFSRRQRGVGEDVAAGPFVSFVEHHRVPAGSGFRGVAAPVAQHRDELHQSSLP